MIHIRCAHISYLPSSLLGSPGAVSLRSSESREIAKAIAIAPRRPPNDTKMASLTFHFNPIRESMGYAPNIKANLMRLTSRYAKIV